jgi:SAM-dependent methyltransferase
MPDHDEYFYGMRLKRIIMKRVTWPGLYRLLPESLSTNRLPGITGRVHTLDLMMAPLSRRGLDHYISVGQSAIANIEETLAAAEITYDDVVSCLDFPCGYGRVLRWLRLRIEPARITASDIDRRAVDFCHSEFGVKPLYSADDFEQVKFPQRYALIWVGSLLTHLDSDRSLALLKRLVEVLDDRGLLIFTTQGQGYLTDRGLPPHSKRFRAITGQLKEGFHKDGYCYTPLSPSGYYGLAFHSNNYIERLMAEHFRNEVKLLRFKERGWDGRQDVWSYQRV